LSSTAIISEEQARLLLELHLDVGAAPEPAAGLAGLAQAITDIIAARVAFLFKLDRVWSVSTESRLEPSPPPAGRIGPTFDRVAELPVPTSVQRWNDGHTTWTLVPCGTRPGPPAVMAIEGDWTHSSRVLLLLAGNVSQALCANAVSSRARLRLTTHQLSSHLSRATGRKAVCDAIVRSVARAVSAQIAAVAVADLSDRRLSIVATHGYPLALVEHLRIEPGAGILGAVFQSGRVMHVRNILTLPQPHRPRPRYRSSSFVAVPVRASREILGVICVTDRSDNQPFTHADVSTLRGLAAPAALALGRERALLQAEAYAHAAAIDPLSGAFNRRHFHARLEEELQRSQRHEIQLALLMIDIDDFKSVNDSFGHLAGDAVIKGIADIMRRSVRVFDVCARFGGEEFAIIMPGSGTASALGVAERIRERIESFRPSDPVLEGLSITASVGLAVSSSGISAREIIARADQALYRAKRAGKNRVREYEQNGTL
jgi:diguanylate cyclase (GGDEF)-like protein